MYDRREILRYAGVRKNSPDVEELLMQCIREIKPISTGKVCWCRLSMKEAAEMPPIAAMLNTNGLGKHLAGCNEIVIFAATVGIEIDRTIAKYSTLSPTKSLLASAIGTERIEALCDVFEESVKAEGRETRFRFSPGYSDLPIECQKDIFDLLDCPRKIGLTLNDSMLMSPSKSVSAIIGIV